MYGCSTQIGPVKNHGKGKKDKANYENRRKDGGSNFAIVNLFSVLQVFRGLQSLVFVLK